MISRIRRLRRLAFFRFGGRINPEDSRLPRRVGKSRNAIGEPGLFTHAPVETRAAAIAQNRREQIDRRDVRMRDLRDVPGERKASQFGGKLFMHFAPAELGWLRRDVDRLE